MDELREWYEPDGDPREALGRYARRLRGGGALYLGGGVGVEAVSKKLGNDRVESYALVPSGTKFDGPLSAVTAAFTAAGKSTGVDTPGGTTTVAEPSIAARLHELDASEREEKATITRYTARLANRAKQGALSYTSGLSSPSDDQWEARRIEEARANLTAIAAERTRLLAGKLSESGARLPAEAAVVLETAALQVQPPDASGSLIGELREAEAGKPGTNWKQVSAPAKKKLGGILAHYKSSAKPFTECVADNTKRFGPEGAKKVCAVVKDLNEKSTGWRKGGKVAEDELVAAVLEAEGRLAVVDETLGEGAAAVLAMSAPPDDLVELAEMCFADVSLLYLSGDERARVVLEGAAGEQPRHRDGKWTNVLARVSKVADRHPLEGPDQGLRLNTPHPAEAPVPVAESGLVGAMFEAGR